MYVYHTGEVEVSTCDTESAAHKEARNILEHGLMLPLTNSIPRDRDKISMNIISYDGTKFIPITNINWVEVYPTEE